MLDISGEFGYSVDRNRLTKQACKSYKRHCKIVRKIEASYHVYEYTMTKEATCKSASINTGVCTKCGDTITGVIIGEIGTHKLGEYYKNYDATCTEDGTKTASCIYCHVYEETVTDVGSKSGHNFYLTSEVVEKETCYSDRIVVAECAGNPNSNVRCTATEVRAQKDTKTDHVFTEYGGVYKEANCTE